MPSSAPKKPHRKPLTLAEQSQYLNLLKQHGKNFELIALKLNRKPKFIKQYAQKLQFKFEIEKNTSDEAYKVLIDSSE